VKGGRIARVALASNFVRWWLTWLPSARECLSGDDPCLSKLTAIARGRGAHKCSAYFHVAYVTAVDYELEDENTWFFFNGFTL
jgi:hypothetical protein